ncbi:uncharacterized protein LOC122509999 [Leptopilina heterotoma]|uniref:uncharacterized protein LOC122509999 n=1 Tax=Leptopilina heterotoma TaxID=63436 RepID=UPI001CA885AB|nr:uncharacterized protein LOC122509999 [Leptopilina heterotoma]
MTAFKMLLLNLRLPSCLEEEKTCSTIEEPAKLKNIADGDEANLTVKGVSYKITVIARSESRTFLDEIDVSEDGKIIPISNNSSNSGHRKKNNSSEKTSKNKSKEAVQTQINKEVMGLRHLTTATAEISTKTEVPQKKNLHVKKHQIVSTEERVSRAANFSSEEKTDSDDSDNIRDIKEPTGTNKIKIPKVPQKKNLHVKKHQIISTEGSVSRAANVSSEEKTDSDDSDNIRDIKEPTVPKKKNLHVKKHQIISTEGSVSRAANVSSEEKTDSDDSDNIRDIKEPTGTNKKQIPKDGSFPLGDQNAGNATNSINNVPEFMNLMFPKVTPEIVAFLGQLAIYAQNKLHENATENPFANTTSSENTVPQSSSSTSSIAVVVNGELFINPRHEIEFLRFKKRPEEMIRRLMLTLVGKEELKTMTALGYSRSGREGKPIPEDIRNAVYKYVKNKSKALTYEKYVEVLNNQCGTLRKPRKNNDTKKSDKSNETTGQGKEVENVDNEDKSEERENLSKPTAEKRAKKRKPEE